MTSRRLAVLAVAAVALALAALLSLALGAERLPLSSVVDALAGDAEPGPVKEIVQQLRAPRTVSALLVGAALAVSGALLQGALANPLASPDIIGVTGGAGFGAVLVLLAFPEEIALVPAGALVFGIAAAILVLGLGWSATGSVARLILAGIAVSALFGAATTSLMVAFPDRVPSAIGFLAGGLTSDGWRSLEVVWPYFAVGFVVAALVTGPLDRLVLGDDVAESLGVNPRRVRLAAGIGAALLAAAAAALAGLLGFLGLVIPHLIRLASGTGSNRYVVPVSAVAGAALLLAGDTLARVVARPIELPVGPLMVVLGVPLFLVLLRRAV